MSSPDTRKPKFDASAPRHGAALHEVSLWPSDGQNYFARGRVRWLRRCLEELGERPATVLDFGCGAGSTTPYFFEELEVRSLVGVEVSRELLAAAERTRAHAQVTYVQLGDYRAAESIDLAYSNSVFHRIPPRERMAAAVLVYRSLKSGGLFAFWENNPWSPGSLLGMLDGAGGRGPATLAAPAARRLLRGVGFDIVHTTSAFYFPRALAWCRPIEPMLASIPLGEQYMVLARKP